MFRIVDEKTVFNEKLVVEELKLSSGGEEFTKQRLKRADAAVVLILNTESDKVVLVKQYRYAIASKTDDLLCEIVAGKIDEGEEPVDAAIREVLEETGYRIKPANIQLLLTCFSSPGYSSERFHIYCATVTNSDKVSKGGGLEKEHERVKVIEMARNEFTEQLKTAGFRDAKTYVAGLYSLLLWK